MIGGVLLFFDRAMYAPLFPYSQAHSLTALSFPRLAMGNVHPHSPHPPFSPVQSLTTTIDTLPNRPNHNNRPSKNASLLRAPPKTQRNSSLLWRTSSDPDALGPDRFPGRAIRDIDLVWGFLRHDCGLCEEYSCDWAVYWDGG